MDRFVLLSMPRTGSSMVAAMLGTHPDIVCLPAVFSDSEWHGYSAAEEGAWKMTERLQPLKARWERLEDRLADMPGFLRDAGEVNEDLACWGFKQHLGPRGNERTSQIISLNWPTILLRRENILACYSSNKIVELTGQGKARMGETVITAKALFDADEFTRYCRRRRAVYDYWNPLIEKTGVPTMCLDYSQARTLEGMRDVARFLGQTPDQFGSWPTAKRNADTIVDRFLNPEEVSIYLEDHDLGHWAQEQ